MTEHGRRPAFALCMAAIVSGAGAGAGSAQTAAAAPPLPPTTVADVQAARTLDVDRYRPHRPLAGCAGAPLPRATPDARLAAGIAAAQAYSDSKAGLGLIVLHDGRIVHEHYAGGLSANRALVSASLAKTVLGLVMGIAIDKGLVAGVDAPLSRYLPEWADDPRGQISIAQALQMRTGLGPSDFRAVLLGPDVNAAALATPQAGRPGDVFAYNNAVSQLLLMVVDRAARAAGVGGYAALLEQELWCPLGNGPANLWVDPAGNARGFAGLNATPHDWARIGELLRNNGKAGGRQLVPATWVTAMATPSPANAQYGYLLWLGREWTAQRRYSRENPVTVPHGEAFVAPDIVYLDGFGGQRVYVIPSRKLTIVRFGEVDLGWDDAVVPNAIARAVD